MAKSNKQRQAEYRARHPQRIKERAKKEQARFRAKDPVAYAKKQREYYRKRKDDYYETLYQHKANNPCMRCGIKYPPQVMDFHHRDSSTKTMSMGQIRSVKRLLEEIEKCDLLCANCHRLVTFCDATY